MSIDIRFVDEGLGDDDEPLAQIDVRYTSAEKSALNTIYSVKPLLVIQMGKSITEVNDVMQEIAQRSKDGQSTVVPVALIDQLGLRDRLEELALEMFP